MGLDAQQIRRGTGMPPAFTALWRIRMCAEILLRWRQECAAVQHRDEVPAAPLWGDAFGNEERGSIKGDLRAEFLACASLDTMRSHFFVSDDAAGNMPARSKEFVVTPGEQGAAGVVFDQEIDIDKGGDAADEKEELFREAVARVIDGGFQLDDCGAKIHKNMVYLIANPESLHILKGPGTVLAYVLHDLGARFPSWLIRLVLEIDSFFLDHIWSLLHLCVYGTDIFAQDPHGKQLYGS